MIGDLGSFPLSRWQKPREKALENRRAVERGEDINRTKGEVPTFRDALEEVLIIHKPTWKDGSRHGEIWRNSLYAYAVPTLGDMPVDKISTGDVLAVLTPIWNTKRDSARRVRQRIGMVMKMAVAQGYRIDNPAGESVGAALPRGGAEKQHYKALPYPEVAEAIKTVQGSEAWMSTKLAFEFLVLTATRSGEVRKATWDEINLEAKVWTIPDSRMKTGKEHRIPLSPRALEVLAEARDLADGTGLVFPSVRSKVLSDMTLSKLVKELGIEAVPHGFRSSFRDWAAECSNAPREVAEEALAHVNPNRVEAAYRRTDLFERRRQLMGEWDSYLNGKVRAS